MKEVLAIIPARGGSKGIARKNIRLFNGVPLVAVTIWQALQSRTVTRTVVSTDDDEIAGVSLEYGAEVIRRPVEISGDEAPSEAALLHCLDELVRSDGYRPDLVAFLQCTSPIRQPQDIDNAVETLLRENADSLLSVVPSHRFLWVVADSVARPLNYDHNRRPRRQDRNPEYLENGSLYLFKPWVLHQSGNRLGGKISLHVMHESAAFEIDDLFDFELVEWIGRRLNIPLPSGQRSD